mmetsp:Transcript_9474/g.18453  ORF Transcript_9474/g.18453 Transcript_9474/m.18453 type:complete len:84 (-) Transcript_9474:611-862(-)
MLCSDDCTPHPAAKAMKKGCSSCQKSIRTVWIGFGQMSWEDCDGVMVQEGGSWRQRLSEETEGEKKNKATDVAGDCSPPCNES